MRPKIIGLSLVILAAVLIFGTLAYYVVGPRRPHVDVNRTMYPVRGIDISKHNGDIDFEQVAADSIDFVYIKATEGARWRDPKFTDNFDAARRAGLPVGVYHFFRFDVSGLQQAYNLLDAIKDRNPDLPVAIDLEEWANSPDVNTESIVDHLTVMLDRLQADGIPVIIYTNKNGYTRFVHGRFDNIDTWICSFTDPPLSGKWQLWQHSHCGKVKGIKGDVDLNTFNSPRADWRQWLNQSVQQSAMRRP